MYINNGVWVNRQRQINQEQTRIRRAQALGFKFKYISQQILIHFLRVKDIYIPGVQ
jgi:hypothetical protein